MAASTSYDFWWPYPPWGATTAVPAPTALPPTATVSSASTMLVVSATNLLSSAARPVVETSSLASSTSSASIIKITALPPSNGTTSQKYTGGHTGFNIVYLAPLFAVLAAIAGALSTWYLLRWHARRRDRQAHGSSILHTGPRYAPPPEYSENSVPQGSDSSSGSSANEASTLLQGHTDSEKKGWVARAFSRSSRQSQAVSMIPPVTPVGRQPPTRDAHNMMDTPYSAVDNDAPVEESRAIHLGNEVSQRPGAHHLAANVASPEMLSPGSADVPYETLRHKSIRRAILERLKFGTLRRPTKAKVEDQPDVESGRIQNSPARRVGSRRGHRRNDSDFNIEDLQRQDGNPSRANTVMHGNLGRSPMMSPPGFRIIEEDVEAAHPGEDVRLMATHHREGGSDLGTPARENPAWKWIASWSPSPSIRTEDSYTALPIRRATTKKGPASAAPTLPRTDEYPSVLPEITRVDSSILPSSPPQVMSPPLHSRLFFSDFGSSPSLDLNLSKEQADPARVAVSTPGRHVNRLHTKREPEPLPFPSTSGASPYRGRLKKPHTVRTINPPLPSSPEVVVLDLPQHVPVSPMTPYDEQAYAERLLARQSALDKVGEIVSRGLSQRDIATSGRKVQAEPLPGIATDRGTRMEVRDGMGAATGQGIEQRLGLLKESESAVLEQC